MAAARGGDRASPPTAPVRARDVAAAGGAAATAIARRATCQELHAVLVRRATSASPPWRRSDGACDGRRSRASDRDGIAQRPSGPRRRSSQQPPRPAVDGIVDVDTWRATARPWCRAEPPRDRGAPAVTTPAPRRRPAAAPDQRPDGAGQRRRVRRGEEAPREVDGPGDADARRRHDRRRGGGVPSSTIVTSPVGAQVGAVVATVDGRTPGTACRGRRRGCGRRRPRRRAASRRCRAAATTARSSTAWPSPSAPVTTLAQWCMP